MKSIDIIWDLDETLADTRFLKKARDQRDWSYCRKNIDRVRLFPDIREVFDTLSSGNLIAVVTSSPKWYAQDILDRCGLSPQVLIAYGDTRRHKPHPDPLLKAQAGLHAGEIDTWSIGDSVSDHVASEQAGIKFIGVTWGETTRQDWEAVGLSRVVDHPRDILSQLLS